MVSPTCFEPHGFIFQGVFCVCVQYGMLYMHPCELSDGKGSVFLSTTLLTPMHVKHTVLHLQLSPWG